MIISGDFPNGIKFIGTEGWIFVSRGNEQVTASDPVAKLQDAHGAGRERSEDHQVGDRAGRDPSLREQGPSRQLARVHPLAAPADRARRGRAPRLLDVPAAPHRDEDQAQAATGTRSRSASRTTTRRTRCCRDRCVRHTCSTDGPLIPEGTQQVGAPRRWQTCVWRRTLFASTHSRTQTVPCS